MKVSRRAEYECQEMKIEDQATSPRGQISESWPGAGDQNPIKDVIFK